ncbi:MAG TPA: outer membrane beta-barrel protein [Polyangiaceae bacterium]|nr:outer membrane beta-barrel protein [Polyangiaceae bacterium]
MKRATRNARGSIKLWAAGTLAAAGTLFASGTAHAQDSRAELGVYGGYLFGTTAEGESVQPDVDSSQYVTSKASISSAPSYGATLDLAVRRGAFAEISYSRSPSDLSLRVSNDPNTYKYDLLQQHIQIGGLLEFKAPGAPWFRPLFGGTIGATIFSADDKNFSYSEGALSVIFEGGAKLVLSRFFGVRLRARLLGTFLNDESALLCVGGSCAYAYSGTVMLQGELGGGLYVAF